MNFRTVSEDGIELEVPDVRSPELGRAEGFYNPEMRTNRDISISAAAVFLKQHGSDIKGEIRIADSLSATGIRALRYKKTFPSALVVANDVNDKAVELISKNAARNELDVEVRNEDAKNLLLENSFDIVDIDPYGSPIQFVEPGFTCFGKAGLLCATATDTACLNGSMPQVAERRYGVRSLDCAFAKELGVRILITAIMRSGFRTDRAFTPLLNYQEKHYIRLFGLVQKGAERCNELLKQFDYLTVCRCGRWFRGIAECCPDGCTTIGPLYLGQIQDKNFCSAVLSDMAERGYDIPLMSMIADETSTLFYYDLHELASLGKMKIPKFDVVLDKLRQKHEASRTHFCDTAVKTDAPLNEVIDAMKG